VSAADLLTSALAREISGSGVSVFAVTSPATVAAALAARELGASELALAGGFTGLDAAPEPALTRGEAALFAGGEAPRDWVMDTFLLLSRGRVGVAVAPAQLDAAGRTNLSGIGPPGAPKVALTGARGLPDNNHSPSRVWYLLPAHSGRQLVERVDVTCGVAPPPGCVRHLLTPAGCFELARGGWRALWLTPSGAELVAAAPGLGVELTGAEEIVAGPDPEALAAVERADPRGVRRVEFASGEEAARLWQQIAEMEMSVP
jgi:hypothetical protein